MWKRVRKPLPAEAVAAPKRTHFSDNPLTVAELGHEIEVHTLPDGTLSDHIINSTTRQEFNPSYLRFGVMTGDFHANEQGFLLWEELNYALLDWALRTLTSPMPPPELTLEPHWTTLPGGYGLDRAHLPRVTAPGQMRTDVLVSPNVATADRLVVILSAGSCGLGAWNRAILTRGPFSLATYVDIVDGVLETFEGSRNVCWADGGTGVIIGNPGERNWSTAAQRPVTAAYAQGRPAFPVIPDQRSVEAHVEMLVRDYILGPASRARKIYFLCAGWSGVAIVETLKAHFGELEDRVRGVGLMHSQHKAVQLSSNDTPDGFATWFRQRALAVAANPAIHTPRRRGPPPPSAPVDASAPATSQPAPPPPRQTFGHEVILLGDGRDQPFPALATQQGCMVIAGGTEKPDLLGLFAPRRILEFFASLDAVDPAIATKDVLARFDALQTAEAEAAAAAALEDPDKTLGWPAWAADAQPVPGLDGVSVVTAPA